MKKEQRERRGRKSEHRNEENKYMVGNGPMERHEKEGGDGKRKGKIIR